MAKLRFKIAMSLDGYTARPQRSDDVDRAVTVAERALHVEADQPA